MARNNKIICCSRSRIVPKKTIYLACEGGDCGTEATYIKQLCKKYNCTIVWFYKKSDTDPLSLAQYAIEFSKKQETYGKSELWIVFDNDKPVKVRQAYTKVQAFNHSVQGLKKKYMPVNIAFNAPSIETFGLLCCGITKISTSAKTNQSKLRAPTMPGYSHEKTPHEGPYFDFTTMENGYNNAMKQAKQWAISFCEEPECTATVFAGIYKLTESIKG